MNTPSHPIFIFFCVILLLSLRAKRGNPAFAFNKNLFCYGENDGVGFQAQVGLTFKLKIINLSSIIN